MHTNTSTQAHVHPIDSSPYDQTGPSPHAVHCQVDFGADSAYSVIVFVHLAEFEPPIFDRGRAIEGE